MTWHATDDRLIRLRLRYAESLERLARAQELIAETQALVEEARVRREIAAAVAASTQRVLERLRGGPATESSPS